MLLFYCLCTNLGTKCSCLFKGKNSKVKSTSKYKKVWIKAPPPPVCLDSSSSLFKTSSAEVQSWKQLFIMITVVTSVSLENLMGKALIKPLSFLNISGQHNCRRGWGWRHTGFISFYTSQQKTAQKSLSWKSLGFPTSPAPGYHLQPWPVSYGWAARCSKLTGVLMTSPLTINSSSCNIFSAGYQRGKHQILLLLPHYAARSLQEADMKA